ncbi:hypothetical protein C8J57DRAFT_55731 [Mycena rebaudengoi]|nr:hypothetical protein C8J57DRAFT_55731 [Mycena rebaudengoi]
MTATLVQFSVEDGSPTITYAPFPDTFTSPNLTAGWNPFFDSPGFSSATVGATGSGTSFHITSLDGASFQIRWKGTGIQLLGNVTRSTYTLEIDGKATDASSSADPAKNILATINDLADTNHTLSLTMHTNQQEDPLIKFDKAIISAPPSPTKASTLNFTEQVVNETAFNFRGRWSFQNDSNPAHRSTTAGDSAAIQFTGTSFLLRGSTSPDAGRYSVTLDNITTSFSGRSSFTQSDSLLFFASGLDAEVPHNLEIVNTQGAALVLPVGGASVFSLVQTPPSTSSSTPSASSISASAAVGGKGLSTGTIAALVLAGILIFFIALSLLLYFLLYRPYRRRQQLLRREQAKDDQDAGSVLVVDVRPDSAASKKRYSDLPPVMAGPSRDRTSKRSGFARWKEEVEGGLGSWGRGALGIAFRHSDSSGRDASGRLGIMTWRAAIRVRPPLRTTQAGRGKGKGKAEKAADGAGEEEKSLSPRFKLDLPVESEQTGSQFGTGFQPDIPNLRLFLLWNICPRLHYAQRLSLPKKLLLLRAAVQHIHVPTVLGFFSSMAMSPGLQKWTTVTSLVLPLLLPPLILCRPHHHQYHHLQSPLNKTIVVACVTTTLTTVKASSVTEARG